MHSHYQTYSHYQLMIVCFKTMDEVSNSDTPIETTRLNNLNHWSNIHYHK